MHVVLASFDFVYIHQFTLFRIFLRFHLLSVAPRTEPKTTLVYIDNPISRTDSTDARLTALTLKYTKIAAIGMGR